MTYTKQSQRGFVLVAAIFLLVILAALGAFMVTFSSSQHLTSAQDVQGSRAYWAARAGLEWSVSSIAADPKVCPVPPAPFNVDGFALAIECSFQGYDEGSTLKRVFWIKSIARTDGNVGSLGYIERSLSASVEF